MCAISNMRQCEAERMFFFFNSSNNFTDHCRSPTKNNPTKNHFYEPQSNENLKSLCIDARQMSVPKNFPKVSFTLTGTHLSFQM